MKRLLPALIVLGVVIYCAWRATHPTTSKVVDTKVKLIDQQPVSLSNTSLLTANKTQASSDSIADLPTPTFPKPSSPKVIQLRQRIFLPWQETRNEDALRQVSLAISELAAMRTLESINALAELLFADQETYFHTYYRENGTIRGHSPTIAVMADLEFALENTPVHCVSDTGLWGEVDLKTWRDWWLTNKDKLQFREKGKVPPRLLDELKKTNGGKLPREVWDKAPKGYPLE